MVEQSPQILVSEEKAHHHDLNYLRLKSEKCSFKSSGVSTDSLKGRTFHLKALDSQIMGP